VDLVIGWIRDDLARSVSYITFVRGPTHIGCIGVEPLVGSVVELKRLAVLPEHRRQGLGARLVHRGVEQARSAGATEVEVSVIADHLDLIRWYERLGFAQTVTRRFSHLPFTVAYLTKSP
jgi:diamine N-acetyltransferase